MRAQFCLSGLVQTGHKLGFTRVHLEMLGSCHSSASNDVDKDTHDHSIARTGSLLNGTRGDLREGRRVGLLPKGGAPKDAAPEPRKMGPRRMGARNFALFSLSRQFSFSLGGPFVEFWWCSKRQGPEVCMFGVVGLSCETLTSPFQRGSPLPFSFNPPFKTPPPIQQGLNFPFNPSVHL